MFKADFLEFVRWLPVLTLLASIPRYTLETEANQNKDTPTQSKNSPDTRYPVLKSGIEVLSDTEGVDFNSYFRELYWSVKKRWIDNLPPSVQKGQQGKNAVEFQIQRDGTVPKDSLKVVLSSEKSDLDEASLRAVREAAPFSRLPEKFSKPFIVLRLTFYYNPGLQKP